jgi:hypothetical protein
MKIIFNVFPFFILFLPSVSAQQTTFQDSLLDHFIGKWVLQGTIAGKETTHDVAAEWVLGHQYLQFHEISREKDSTGAALYEAIVFIGWDQPSDQYACLWLDVTGGGGLSPQAIGCAKRSKGTIAFVFKVNDGSLFHTTFLYNQDTDTWQWLMDGEENGKMLPFARVVLTKKLSYGF